MPQHRRPRDPRSRRPTPPGSAPGGSPGEVSIDLGLGEMLKGLGGFVELIGRMAESGQSTLERTGEVRGPGEAKGVYGFSVKVGIGGRPTVERFGNVRTDESGTEVSEVREPLTDVFDEDAHILVVAELPGINADDIRLEVKDDILNLSATGSSRKYAKEILLPSMVDPASERHSYQNGFLEIRLAKTPSEA